MPRIRSIVIPALAVSALVPAVIFLLLAGYARTWHGFGMVFYGLSAYALALLATTLLAIGAISSSRRKPWYVGIIVSCTAIGIAQIASNNIAQASRESEIQTALDAGLERDCRNLFAKYQTDPRFKGESYVRIFPYSDEYQTLPRSIRLLKPIYVTIEDHAYGSDLPANIGLCKNGFGGFAHGVRVFVDNENIPQPYQNKHEGLERVTRTIFLWHQET